MLLGVESKRQSTISAVPVATLGSISKLRCSSIGNTNGVPSRLTVTTPESPDPPPEDEPEQAAKIKQTVLSNSTFAHLAKTVSVAEKTSRETADKQELADFGFTVFCKSDDVFALMFMCFPARALRYSLFLS